METNVKFTGVVAPFGMTIRSKRNSILHAPPTSEDSNWLCSTRVTTPSSLVPVGTSEEPSYPRTGCDTVAVNLSPACDDLEVSNRSRVARTKAPAGTLPDLRDSGSVVAAADFDRDGDLDLFVGGRCNPGKYPLAPNSRLLRNDQGRFTDVTGQLAPGLEQSGLVTSAVWSDANGDGWLVVRGEWGVVANRVDRNGNLVERLPIAVGDGGSLSSPAVAWGANKYLVAWTEQDSIRAAFIDSDGNLAPSFVVSAKVHSNNVIDALVVCILLS